MKQYRPRKGARFSIAQANALGKVLEKIGFEATPIQIVEAARSTSSPIHDLFPWNDKAAAEAHRLQLARLYVNHLEVVVVTDEGERTTKAFHSVIIQRGETSSRGYCSLETIVDNPDLTEQVIANALTAANYWRRTYAEYSTYPQLREIFSAIDSATIKAKRQRKRKNRRRVRAVA